MTGLSETYAGQSLGAEPAGQPYVLEPVMTYRVNLPEALIRRRFCPSCGSWRKKNPSCVCSGKTDRSTCK